VILGFTLWPLHERLRRRVRERRTLAAALTTSALSAVLVLPFVFIVLSLRDDVRELRHATASGSSAARRRYLPGWASCRS